ncbi:hypothetical protein KHQ06_18370 [Nocardia tengchongensis]|uniref:Uncharacterized protein n=1 Tax=Nocardia tengchongensis TaxID=2055889 RepID=A0ABX8CYT1_9NOCA|nr:hypothetical protein [Nocardia tengchongensis]QVI24511.1 hypothetical protein KHQ06_18370 [Nocardia tengchongensis]
MKVNGTEISGGTELKALLRKHHWQTHGTFLREYDKVAAKVEPSMVGHGPQKAQFYRWLTGEIKGLPHPDHCRVLEAMLPGQTADQLFTPAVGIESESDRLSAGESRNSGDPDGSPDAAARERALGALRVSAWIGESNGSRDSVVGSGAARSRSQREATAAIDDRVRSLMSWVGDTAPVKERDLRSESAMPVRPAVDRRRDR